MALNNLSVIPGVKKWSERLFKDLVRTFDRYPSINEKCIAELKELFPEEFAISNQRLKEEYDLKKVKYLGSKIKVVTDYGVTIQALSFNTKKFSINYKVEPYFDKILLNAVSRAVKYSQHKPEIQKKLNKILAELE